MKMENNSFDRHAHLIRNVLVLRPPQEESLLRFQKIAAALALVKEPDLEAELAKIHKLFPTLTSFEREFPSVCFALATGIGKTRLMGAFIAYLHYAKKFKNFFVLAPNLTIYDKLKSDLGEPSALKYVFKGLDRFVSPPRIIDGDNYEEFRQTTTNGYNNDVLINIFNISKLNSDSKTADGKPARIKRLNEVLGQSYFNYLKELPDLCVLMDESHHYHADKSFEVINELKPVLGIELTATPQIQKGAKAVPFKNVVYEYSLASALSDGAFVKEPTVVTRKDFHADDFTPEELDRKKLIDGLCLHEEVKGALDVFAKNNPHKKFVFPFVLVVAKDTVHSAQLKSYLTSPEFLGGRYANKVLEVNSAQRGEEKDENIRALLALEKPENRFEIVIHVNMLKEGWDVANLYTIIPLRTSASETLTEQTIGRGLRLPYGGRTGDAVVDRLAIVSHERYEEIIALARCPNSIVRRIRFIDENETRREWQRETIPLSSVYDLLTQGAAATEKIATTVKTAIPLKVTSAETEKIAQFMLRRTAQLVIDLAESKEVKNISEVKTSASKGIVNTRIIMATKHEFPSLELSVDELKAVAADVVNLCVEALCSKVIPIPRVRILPSASGRYYFEKFVLNMEGIEWTPTDNTLIATELREDGETFEIELDEDELIFSSPTTSDEEIANLIFSKPEVNYAETSDLVFSLIAEAKAHFLTYLSPENTERVMSENKRALATWIFSQMREHFIQEKITYAPEEVLPFSKIEDGFGGKFKNDELHKLVDNVAPTDIPKTIFSHFRKACHVAYKFDSNSEKSFAFVLERDGDVLHWLRPFPKQFNIFYECDGKHLYEPDFVVETLDKIFLVEIKAINEIEAARRQGRGHEIREKYEASRVFCETVSKYNLSNGGKQWEMILLSADVVSMTSSFAFLLRGNVKFSN